MSVQRPASRRSLMEDLHAVCSRPAPKLLILCTLGAICEPGFDHADAGQTCLCKDLQAAALKLGVCRQPACQLCRACGDLMYSFACLVLANRCCVLEGADIQALTRLGIACGNAGRRHTRSHEAFAGAWLPQWRLHDLYRCDTGSACSLLYWAPPVAFSGAGSAGSFYHQAQVLSGSLMQPSKASGSACSLLYWAPPVAFSGAVTAGSFYHQAQVLSGSLMQASKASQAIWRPLCFMLYAGSIHLAECHLSEPQLSAHIKPFAPVTCGACRACCLQQQCHLPSISGCALHLRVFSEASGMLVGSNAS